MDVYKRLFKYIQKEKYLGYIAAITSALSAIFTVGGYYYLYKFLNRIIVEGNLNRVMYYASMIIGLLFLGSFVYIISGLISHVLGFRLETNLRKKGIDGLTSSSFKFFDMNQSGRIRKIIDDNAAQTHMIVAHLIPDNAKVILTPILSIILGFIIDIRVGFGLLALTITWIIATYFMMGDKEYMEKYQNSLEKLSGETVEYVRGIQVIKIFKASIYSFKKLYNAIIGYSKNAQEYSNSCRTPYIIFQVAFSGFAAIVILISLLAFGIKNNPNTTILNLMMIVFLSGVIFDSFNGVMYVFMNSFLGKEAVDKLEKMFDEMHKDKLSFGTCDKFDNYDIEFENVDFGYGEEKVLSKFNLKLEQNKIYALVGASGSGKSTIAKLISGFYKIDSGSIKIGGRDISDYTEEAIMKNIAFVFQNSKLFKKSIFENVKDGNPNASYEEVMNAIKLAGCTNIIEKFKDRENTIIGSKGVYLSGGEIQRISIARAILKDSGIIIMDEASAAVDPENEHELQKAFSNLMKNKTVIMIAHRLTSIRSVDEIIVMENGKIVERGTDNELMKINSRYRKLQELYGIANEWRV